MTQNQGTPIRPPLIRFSPQDIVAFTNIISIWDKIFSKGQTPIMDEMSFISTVPGEDDGVPITLK